MIPHATGRHPTERFDLMLLAVLLGLAIMWTVGFVRNVVAWSYCGQDLGSAIVESFMFDGPSAGECVLAKAGQKLQDSGLF